MRKFFFILALLLPLSSFAEELAVAAASDLSFAMKEIAQEYQRGTGNAVRLSFGASGNFFVQIQNGAPFDLFFSADSSYPEKLAQAGLADPGTLYHYAVGTLVLWVPNDSKLDLKQGIDVLRDPSIRKIAIANPATAPYGRAAEQALKTAGVYDRIKNKLVLGENISQTTQFVQTGNADIGIIAESLALAPTTKSAGRYVEVSDRLYTPIQQAAVVLKSSQRKTAAKQFLDYLQQPAARAILERFGFMLPNR